MRKILETVKYFQKLKIRSFNRFKNKNNQRLFFAIATPFM